MINIRENGRNIPDWNIKRHDAMGNPVAIRTENPTYIGIPTGPGDTQRKLPRSWDVIRAKTPSPEFSGGYGNGIYNHGRISQVREPGGE